MTSVELVKDIAGSARALADAPSDFMRWSALARALCKGGRKELGADAYEHLGSAANRFGQVALAIACGCELRELGAQSRADELVGAIAKLHCRGSLVIDHKLVPAPPTPPPRMSTETRAALGELTAEEATNVAREALASARAAADEHAPSRLPPTPLVESLSRDELRELASVVNQRWVAAGHVVIDIGEPATTLFWIARGDLVVTRDGKELGELRSNAFFGEIALVGATDRTACVTARAPSWILDVPADAIEKLAGRSPRLAKLLANYARARILSNVLRTSTLFSRLSDEEKQSFLPRFKVRLLDPEEVLIEGGAANDSLYVVASGTLEARNAGKLVAVLSVGDGAGEQSLLSRRPAACDVVSSSRSIVLCLARQDFDSMAVQHPGLLAEAYSLLVEREQGGAAVVHHDASNLVI